MLQWSAPGPASRVPPRGRCTSQNTDRLCSGTLMSWPPDSLEIGAEGLMSQGVVLCKLDHATEFLLVVTSLS